MRSRYTAYTQANIPYIQATMRESALERFDPESAKTWALTARWKRLKVLATAPHESDPHQYYVTFEAFYIFKGKPQTLREKSVFRHRQGQWFYIGQA